MTSWFFIKVSWAFPTTSLLVADAGTVLPSAHSQMLLCILRHVLVVLLILPRNAVELAAYNVLLIGLRGSFVAFGLLYIHEVLFSCNTHLNYMQ